MTGGVDPATVRERARALDEATAHRRSDPTALNVHVPDVEGGPEVSAGDRMRLAAAVEALDGRPGGCLHYPAPIHTAAGPWVVLEPLGGRLSTVHAGAGTVVIEFTPPEGSVDARLQGWLNRLEAAIEAARPRHERYPVATDDQGVFTTGMATFALAGVHTDGGVEVRFDVTTTPGTTGEDVIARFEDLPDVESATFEPDVGVTRAHPPDSLRRAAEAATEAAIGDWEYEWFPRPTAFSHIPGEAKLAVGTGRPDDREPDGEHLETCVAILDGILDRWHDAVGGDGR